MHALLICVRSLCAAVPGCVPGCVPGWARELGSWLLGGGAKVARHAELLEALRLPMRQHLPVVGRRASRSFFNAGFCRQQNERNVRHEDPTQRVQRGGGAACSLFALRLKAPKQIGNEAKRQGGKAQESASHS